MRIVPKAPPHCARFISGNEIGVRAGINSGPGPELDLERALDRRPRADLAAPALEVRHPGDELGERALRAPVARVEREVGDRELVARGVLALGEEVVPHLEVAL